MYYAQFRLEEAEIIVRRTSKGFTTEVCHMCVSYNGPNLGYFHSGTPGETRRFN